MGQTISDTAMLAELRRTSAWQEIEARNEQQREETRARAGRDHEDAVKARDRALPKAEAKLVRTHDELVKARAELQRAEEAHRTAWQQRQSIHAEYRAVECRVTSVLRETAPPELLETRRQIDARVQAARAGFRLSDVLPAPQFAANPKAAKTHSNAAPVTALMQAAVAGIRRIDRTHDDAHHACGDS
jgi:chromosome segregation ATPase